MVNSTSYNITPISSIKKKKPMVNATSYNITPISSIKKKKPMVNSTFYNITPILRLKTLTLHNLEILIAFLNSEGSIKARYSTQIKKKTQRTIIRLIKKGRVTGILPFTYSNTPFVIHRFKPSQDTFTAND